MHMITSSLQIIMCKHLIISTKINSAIYISILPYQDYQYQTDFVYLTFNRTRK